MEEEAQRGLTAHLSETALLVLVADLLAKPGEVSRQDRHELYLINAEFLRRERLSQA